MELIRLLLIEQETGESPEGLSDYSQPDQIYNLQIMSDAGLVVARFIPDEGEAHAATVHRLTWAGHDFLDATKDSRVWKMAKDHVIKPGASWTFSILVEWLKLEARRRVFGDQTSSCDSTPPHVV